MNIVEKLRRQADADDKAGTLYSHVLGREAANEIERLNEALRIAVAAFETRAKAAHEAAELLRDEAAILRDCSTVSGEWDADDREVLAAFNRMMELAHRLEVNLNDGLCVKR